MITRIGSGTGSGSEEVRMNMENKNGEIAVVAMGAKLPCELASTKKELRIMAAAKIAELRGRAEQALSRTQRKVTSLSTLLESEGGSERDVCEERA
ncbi:hypothetical protein AHAS_Ahas15G0363500 [Arachis hypogaea]